MARRPHATQPPRQTGPRVNRMITSPQVLVIGAEGEKMGVLDTDTALAMAEESGLDLVEVSPNGKPPVCKILDYGKLKYQEQKKASEARKRQKTVDVKEIKMRPNIDTHDYEVKMRNVVKFLEGGDKVKVTMRFRGREMAHQELGMDVLNRVRDDVNELSKVEAMPKMEGRQMIMVLAPK
ncbi:translation initiation factor IF-3 [Alphaproteobacteria bacterium]|nr:translation initiation factor IF-3 [Alphaproteobacteria bacterium]